MIGRLLGTLARVLPATQTEQEAGTSLSTIVTPARQQLHPSAAKAWGNLTIAGGAIATSRLYNCTAAYTATGRFTITIGTDFSDTEYAIVHGVVNNAATFVRVDAGTKTAGVFELQTRDAGGALADPSAVSFACYGDQ